MSIVYCEFGDATFNNKSTAKFVDTDVPNGVASIYGDGSLTMIVALLALVSSAVLFCLTVAFNKKKEVSITANVNK